MLSWGDANSNEKAMGQTQKGLKQRMLSRGDANSNESEDLDGYSMFYAQSTISGQNKMYSNHKSIKMRRIKDV